MCSKATCRKCGKTTWSGCGQHVEQVMSGVSADNTCTCGSKTQAPAADKATPTAGGRVRSLFRR